MEELQLSGVIDAEFKSGLTFTKCSHAFHFDCLQEYQTAERQLSREKEYMRHVVGIDDDCIQCPICKTFKNAWQPFLPLGLLSSSDDDSNNVVQIEPYIDFCSQLISNHWQSKSPASILAVDIKADPQTFVVKMCAVVTHMVLESTCLNNQSFLAPFDP